LKQAIEFLFVEALDCAQNFVYSDKISLHQCFSWRFEEMAAGGEAIRRSAGLA
jgi:hypothetical protein